MKNHSLKKVRDGSIVIKSCQGKTGSYYVEIELENTSDADIEFEMKQGQVFEQNRFRDVQNLAVKNFYDNLPPGCTSCNKTLTFTIPKKSTRQFKLECLCIDQSYSCPRGEEMNATPLICIAVKNNDKQREAWEETNRHDIYV